ncbi:hypothetical protein HPB48_023680 [Haemaphysalis longicornis]|uniref:Clathrin light chain n=1 Tax=Haemaphysalis longicornis TaxID=44386 RepID=A0A9J6H8G6_HAELO|nr:hypothetical protein HPB48_023680 [Haemaphysalis longicornis]
MADFDQFEANFDTPPVTEEDPAAEFLAREQNVLAGLEDDNFDGVTMQPTIDGLMDDVAAEVQMNGPSQAPAVVPDTSPRPTPVREEPEKIKKWREEQAKRLEQKDAEEEEKKTELRANAKKELEEWYARYHEQIEKSKLANRARSGRPSPSLCDFNPKASRNSKDVSRMRSIILQLKQSPPQAATKSP